MLRALLTLIFLGSLAMSGWNMIKMTQNPALGALTERTGAELTAALNRALIQSASQEQINARLETLLSEKPTQWLAVQAVQDVAKFREIQIPPALTTEIRTRYDAEHGLLQTSGKCLSCGWDASTCELSAILLCRAPVDLTPVGDITGVIRESGNYVLGNDVDHLDLTLSAVGLGATVLAPATGGSSLAVKLGASTLKTTKKLGNLSPGLARMLNTAAKDAIDWKKVSQATPFDFPKILKEAVDPDAIAPITDTLKAAGDIRNNTGAIETLYLMKYLESAQDATRTARVSSRLGPRTIAAFEVVGKSRLLRATLRYTDEAIGAITALISAFMSALGLLLSSIITKTTCKTLKRTR